MKKRIIYSLFLSGIWLRSVTYLEGVTVDSDYRWAQCRAIINEGSLYTIQRDVLVEILLQAGANPNTPDEEGVFPIEQPVLKTEPIKDPFSKPEIDIEPILVPDPQILMESNIGILLFAYGAEMPYHFYKQRAAFGMKKLREEDLEKHKNYRKQYWEEYKFKYNPVKEAILRSGYSPKKSRKEVSAEQEKFLTQLLHYALVIFDTEMQMQSGEMERFRRTNKNAFPLTTEMLFAILLDIGVDINKTDQFNKTLLQYAREAQVPTIIDILKEHGAKDAKP